MTPLPAALLVAIAPPAQGRVTLIVGAGSSHEPPTNLPLAGECAREAHRRLRQDGILTQDCPDASDLSAVADAVVLRHGSQAELVQRMPMNRFRLARPNAGHLIAAALLRERALNCVMTLNFDLALTAALGAVDAGDDVAIIAGPSDHHLIGLTNVIYLHRNVNSPPQDWILTSAALSEAWAGRWEEVVAARVMGGGVAVFAGLGTPAAVLLHTVSRIRAAVLDAPVFLVDVVDRHASVFFAELGLPAEAYLQMSWIHFAQQLAARVVAEHRDALRRECERLIATEHWPAEDVSGLCDRFAALGLVGSGRVRACWIESPDAAYRPHSATPASWVADILLALGLIERLTEAAAVLSSDGVVEFRHGDRIGGCVIPAHGRGEMRWLTLEARLRHTWRAWSGRDPQPRRALAAGIVGTRPHVAAPTSIVGREDPRDILSGPSVFEMFTVDELRAAPELAARLVS